MPAAPSSCVPLLLMVAFSASAGEWEVAPSVQVSEEYTDNVTLAANSQKSEDFITQVSPSLGLRGKGARLKLDLSYRVQALMYRQDSSRNSTYQQLQSKATAELLKKMVFVDVTASAGQTYISNTGPIGVDNTSVTGNQTDVYTYALSPYFRHHFGTYADTEVRYRFDKVGYSGGAATNSSSTGVDARVTSGRAFSRIGWTLSYNSTKVDNGSASAVASPTSTFRTIGGSLQYRLGRAFSVRGNVGYSDNSFATTQGASGGRSWRLSGIWTPTSRSSLDVGYGSDFFGSSLSLSLKHRSRRTTWTAQYSEAVSTTRDIQLSRAFLTPTDVGLTAPQGGSPGTTLLPGELERLTNQVLVRKHLGATMSVRGRRTDMAARLFHEERDFQSSGGKETTFGVSGTLGRRLSRQMTATLTGSWERTSPVAGSMKYAFWYAGASLRYDLFRNISGTIDIRHAARESDQAVDAYRENRVGLSLSAAF